MDKTIQDVIIETQKKYYPNGLPKLEDFKIGDKVKVITSCQDFYFFYEETGVIKSIKGSYLAIKVEFDEPREFKDGYIQKEFNFNPEDLFKIELKEIDKEYEYKVNDIVKLPFNEIGKLKEIMDYPWGHKYKVEITEGTLHQKGEIEFYKLEQLKELNKYPIYKVNDWIVNDKASFEIHEIIEVKEEIYVFGRGNEHIIDMAHKESIWIKGSRLATKEEIKNFL